MKPEAWHFCSSPRCRALRGERGECVGIVRNRRGSRPSKGLPLRSRRPPEVWRPSRVPTAPSPSKFPAFPFPALGPGDGPGAHRAGRGRQRERHRDHAPRGRLEDITVTASRTPRAIDRTLAVVTSLSRSDLARTPAPTLDDALRQIPGFPSSPLGKPHRQSHVPGRLAARTRSLGNEPGAGPR